MSLIYQAQGIFFALSCYFIRIYRAKSKSGHVFDKHVLKYVNDNGGIVRKIKA